MDLPTADRLALLHRRVLTAAPGSALLRLALAFANNHAFYDNTVPLADRARQLPAVYTPGRRRFNILLQTDSFTQGGLERVVLDLASCLDRQRFTVTLLALGSTGPAWEEARQLGIRRLTLPPTPEAAAYEQFLRENHIDLVNAHYSLAGAHVAARLGIPFVQTIQNTYVWLSPEQVAAHLAADAHTTAYACASANVAYYTHVKLGLPAHKMLVVPNGIDVGRFAMAAAAADRGRLRAKYGLGPGDVVFLSVASIYPPKGQRFLVRALAVVLASCPNARVIFVGPELDLRYGDGLRQDIQRLGLGHAVVFAGYHEDSAPFYAMADAFVLPSLWEGCSLALAEAVAADLAVIATDVGAAREVLSQVKGWLITSPFDLLVEQDCQGALRCRDGDHPRVVRQLAEAMQAFCLDPAVRPKGSHALKSRIDRTRTCAAYGQLYQWLIQGGQPASARAWLRGLTELSSGAGASPT